jgi:tRNA threonylcarbamoyladenosine biosynthesis protein TsaB
VAHGQAEALMPMAAAAMAEAGFPPAALDLVAASVGPGSFTGIRAGLAAARGIALALQKPLVGVTGFEAAAALDQGGDDELLLVALESRRRELFVQLFDFSRRPLAGPAAVAPEALADTLDAAIGGSALRVAGDAAARTVATLSALRQLRSVEPSLPTAVGVARAALCRWRRGERESEVRALYLRSPDVTLSFANRGPPRS